MTHRIFATNSRPPIDERQLAILVGMCVAACREVLTNAAPVGIGTAQLVGDIHKAIETDYTAEKATTQAAKASGQEEQRRPSEATPKLLLTVEEAARQLSIGRPKMWQLVMRGEVLSVKIGASRRIPTTALEAYVERLGAEAQQAIATVDKERRSSNDHQRTP